MIGFLYIILVFAVCFLLAVACKIAYSYFKYKNEPKEPATSSDPKVYYITEKIKKPQKKRRRKKTEYRSVGRRHSTRKIYERFEINIINILNTPTIFDFRLKM